MNIIIQQVVEIIIDYVNLNMETLLKEGKGISDFIVNLKNVLDEVGILLTSGVIEEVEKRVKEDPNRISDWIVKSKDNIKSLATIFGEIKYKRSYYQNKKTGEYKYLVDEILGIKPHDKMDISLKAKLIEEAIDSPYRKSGQKVSDSLELTGQTVMNSIRELGPVENNTVPIKEKNKEVKLLFIEADEDHVSLQNGKNIEPKLVYVHEGRKKVGKNRYKLINKRVFSGVYKSSEDLWLEVADYIDEAYDLDKIEKIYLSGDGASWIKTKESVRDCRRYILNNWEGIKPQYNDDYIGCSSEGHVSHILSDRLSLRPLGWCVEGVDQMSRLRAFKANGGNVNTLFIQRRKQELKEERILKLKKRSIKNKIIRSEEHTSELQSRGH